MALTKNTDQILQWIGTNTKTIICNSADPAGLMFRMYRAFNRLKNVTPTGAAWWVVEEGAWAMLRLAFCGTEREDLPPNPDPGPQRCQCVTTRGALGLQLYTYDGPTKIVTFSPEVIGKKILNTYTKNDGTYVCVYEGLTGATFEFEHYEDDLQWRFIPHDWWLTPEEGATCCDHVPEVPDPDSPTPIPGPNIDDCQWNIEMLDAALDAQGVIRSKYRVYPDKPECGGEFCYWETDAGPRYCPSCEDCPAPFGSEPGAPCEAPQLTGISYWLYPTCEDPKEWGLEPGEYPELEFPIQTANAWEGLAKRIDAVAEMIDWHLTCRQPTCNCAPTLEGEFRTISFRSDDVSPYGKSRLRKRFRYRSVSGLGLDGVVDHWKDFTFQAGPVTVKHVGASWGTITVWASTADEGKRVIRHAAGEAGVDPDQDGRWQIGGSNSARLGVSGTMRVDTKGGYYWITARDGSDHRPLVTKTDGPT